MRSALGYIVILICSVLAALQIRKRNRIEEFQRPTTYQRYQAPVGSTFIVLPLLFLLCFYCLSQFIDRHTAMPLFVFTDWVILTLLLIRYARRKSIENSPYDPPKLRDHLSGLLSSAILWFAYYIQAIKISHDPNFSYYPDVIAGILGYLIHVSLCYAILLLILPLLRKRISARACGYLWMFPLMAIPLFHLGLFTRKPLFVIHTPVRLKNTFIIIWAIGFIGILLWYLVSHLFLRRKLLKNAVPVKDPQIRKLWQDILLLNHFKEPYPQLFYSRDIATPLSFGGGFRGQTTYVFLPQKDYSQEELRLIFYHELIHTGRLDVSAKLNFSILAAFFWFNPLMWIALRRITEDLELSCDETTLLCESSDTRRRYADLLLRTAGSRFGFTTCLSASAKSLRYRLKNTLKPTKRTSGYIIAGLFCMTTLLFQGCIAFTYDPGTGADYILSSVSESDYSVNYARPNTKYDCTGHWLSPPQQLQCTDEEALDDYLSGLQLYRMTGNYWNPDTEKHCWIYLDIDMGEIYIYLDDYTVTVETIKIEANDYTVSESRFYHGGNIDWEYLFGLFEPYQYVPDTSEPVPVETEPKEPPPLPSHK